MQRKTEPQPETLFTFSVLTYINLFVAEPQNYDQ